MLKHQAVRFSFCILVFVFGSFTAQAVPIHSVGAGSAVTSIDASADFESVNALNDNPYIENGLQFSRTNLSFSNNGCGFAGCVLSWGPNWVGNYMYGAGSNGYFTMATTGGQVFYGLEFVVANGYLTDPMDVIWETFLNGSSTGSGVLNVAQFSVFGISDVSGFDELRYTASNLSSTAPAFDSVRAQLSSSSVPEPMIFALLSLGLFGLGFGRRNRG